MWPCFWGTLAKFDNIVFLFNSLILFFIGAFVMRGAGCCINDFFDKEIDKHVERTKNRPLAQGKLNSTETWGFIFVQLIIGFLVIIQFDLKIIVIGFSVIPFVIIYPLLKFFIYFPQFILGLIFNWGIFIGFLSSFEMLDLRIFFLYLAGVFLTIAYDTVYGFQDIVDDKNLGIKSFSIFIENKSNLIITLLYLISFIFFSLFFFSFYENSLFNIVCCFFILSFFFLKILNFIKNKKIIKIFNFNVWYGGFISVLIFLSNYLWGKMI